MKFTPAIIKLLFLSLSFIFISLNGLAQNYKKVKIYIDHVSDISVLYKAGLEFDHPYFTRENLHEVSASAVIVFLNEEDFSKLQKTEYRYEVLIEDWNKYYESLPKLSEIEKQNFINKSKSQFNVSGFGFGSMGGFYTLAEVNAELDSMRMLYPNLITVKQSIGNSVESRPVYMVKISDNPEADENEPEILYTGLHHAREPESMEQMIYFMYYLLENYNTDSTVQYLVNNRELYFIPVVNPDGYEYNKQTNPNGGGFWRKNRKNNGGSYGVDLNRNYGPYNYWNAPNGGSSTTPSSETYRGTAPFSEPETENIKNFLASHKIINALNYHTFGNLLIYPYGALEYETPDSLIFREFAADMTVINNYLTGTDQQTVAYSTRGNSDDYFYDGDTILNGGKIFAMTPEAGNDDDGFWPPQSRIFPLAQENLYPNLYYAWVAGEYVALQEVNFNQQYFVAGADIELIPVMKNKGLSTANNIIVELISLSSFSTVNNSIALIDSIEARGCVTLSSPLTFNISSSAPEGEIIKFLLISKVNSAIMSRDTVQITIGSPVPVELINLNAVIQRDEAKITWTTASELNNKGFEIERSQDYKIERLKDWKNIGFVSGKGTTEERNNYSFTDKTPLRGKSYYRIKQIDFDGSIKIYGPMEVEMINPISYSLEQNYPNPFNPNTVINYSIPKPGLVIIKVYNVLGSEMITLVNEFKEAGKYSVPFNATDLTSGVYFYTMNSLKYFKTYKMIVVK